MARLAFRRCADQGMAATTTTSNLALSVHVRYLPRRVIIQLTSRKLIASRRLNTPLRCAPAKGGAGGGRRARRGGGWLVHHCDNVNRRPERVAHQGAHDPL